MRSVGTLSLAENGIVELASSPLDLPAPSCTRFDCSFERFISFILGIEFPCPHRYILSAIEKRNDTRSINSGVVVEYRPTDDREVIVLLEYCYR